MTVCEEISHSIDVLAPVEEANEEWTQFAFKQNYLRAATEPDESDADENGVVRLEAIDPQTTHVTVKLNYCAHMRGVAPADEIGAARQHLRGTLDRYRSFVETGLDLAA